VLSAKRQEMREQPGRERQWCRCKTAGRNQQRRIQVWCGIWCREGRNGEASNITGSEMCCAVVQRARRQQAEQCAARQARRGGVKARR